MVLVVADYSQAELRVFACISGELFLVGVYKDDRDLHTEVTVAMFGDGYTKEQRVQCKMFNFSYLYGGTEYSFAMDAGLNVDVARQFVQRYNELMPTGLAWKREQLRLARTQGYVETRFGRKRRFPFITQETLDDARKACVHMPCASSASDLTLLSAISLENAGVHVVLTVHDSVIAECRYEDSKEISELMVSTMQRMGDKYFPEVPWKVDVSVRQRWAEPLPHP
jgi:DNA polymerase-1